MKQNYPEPQNRHILTEIWENDPDIFDFTSTPLQKAPLEKIFGDFFAVGKYYYYVLTLADSSLSQHHPDLLEMHGLTEFPQKLSEIIALIHPEDIPFVIEAEKMSYDKVREIGPEHFLHLKTSYCFRMKNGEGKYELFHHQAIHTVQSESGQLLQAVNIHTNIQHLTQKNPYTVIISGTGPRQDFHQLQYKANQLRTSADYKKLSPREMEILNLIVRGNSGAEIAHLLCLSEHTVKTHRRNIIAKMQVRNTKELITKAIELALI